MLASVFGKSNPINYVITIIGLIISYVLVNLNNFDFNLDALIISKKIILLAVLLFSSIITNFISKRNELNKNNSYAFYIFFLFMMLFPTSFINEDVLLANFFILLALRRLVSLQSLIAPKEKIFDASIWIFIACIFEFWSILFIVIVFISILLHVATDYRNWLIPFVAFVAISILYLKYNLLIDSNSWNYLQQQMIVDFNFNYFKNIIQNISLGIFVLIALLFLITQILSYSNKPGNLHNSFKKIIFFCIIALIVFLISPDKSNSLFLFSFAPLSIMGANYIEDISKQWVAEIFLIGFTIISFASLIGNITS